MFFQIVYQIHVCKVKTKGVGFFVFAVFWMSLTQLKNPPLCILTFSFTRFGSDLETDLYMLMFFFISIIYDILLYRKERNRNIKMVLIFIVFLHKHSFLT